MKISLEDAQSDLEYFNNKAAAGDEVIITRSGSPFAKLIPYLAKTRSEQLLGCMKDEITLTAGWDAPLEGEALRSFYTNGE